MVPADVLAEQLAAITHIDALVARDIVRAWDLLGPESRLSTRLIPDLVDVVTEIATAYGEIAGVTAADFYDYVAGLSDARLPAAVAASPVPPKEQVAAVVRWATGPLRFAEPLPDAALKRISGVTQRLAHQPGRATTYNMCRRDGVRYARVPQGKSCAWCTMLAARGGVYYTADRASRSAHSHCDCLVMPIHTESDLPAINRELQDEWDRATAGHRDLLPAWRAYVKETYSIAH